MASFVYISSFSTHLNHELDLVERGKHSHLIWNFTLLFAVTRVLKALYMVMTES